jgi:hypothetical protein
MADPRERWDDMTDIINTGAERAQSKIWTALPVKVVEDSDGFTVKLQPLIKGKQTNPKGEQKDVEMPHLLDVPVQYSAGGGFTITHPIKKDDEGIAIFSSRCIDNWWDKGGVQDQARQRWHSLSDAMYVPGVRSKPRKLGGPDENHEQDYRARGVAMAPKGNPASTNSVQIRSDDGKYYVELGPDGAVNIVCKTLHIQAEDKVEISTKLINAKASDKVHFDTKTFEVSGDIKAGGDVTAHAGVQSVQMNWQPQYPASQGTPKSLDPDSKGYWKPATNTPNIWLMANGWVDGVTILDGDFWNVQTADPDIPEYPEVGTTPGLEGVLLQDGGKAIWHLNSGLFSYEPPPVVGVDPDHPAYEEPWVGVLGIHVLESELTDMMGGMSTAIGMVKDNFSIAGAINEKMPEISHLFNGGFSVAGLTNSMNFNTLVTALPSQVGKIVGNPIVQAVIKLSTHDHHGVKAGPDMSQKPVTGT